MNRCLVCMNHYTQQGRCLAGDRNKSCRYFEEETRGKKVYKTFWVKFRDYEIDGFKESGAYVFTYDNAKKEFEANIRRIIEINFIKGLAQLEIEYHERCCQLKFNEKYRLVISSK